MKKRITALALAFVMVLGTAAVAAGTEKQISVTPMDMSINGQTVTPTKSDGTPAEVFAYDGATYVPLRYLSELLGIQVNWDKESVGVAELTSDKITLPATPAAGFKAGTYTGEGQGFGGTIKVAVTLSDTRIEKVEVTENSETPGIGTPAIEKLPAKIVEVQSTQVDTITAATFASKGILEAVENALKSAGVDPAALKPNTGVGEAKTEELTTDVLVIGGGGAGMSAALEANNAGAKVLLVEWMSFLGGDTGRAGGGIEAAGTRFQEANGIHDKPEDFEAFIRSRGITYRNPNLLTVMTQQSVAAVDFLADLGADMSAQVAGHGSPVNRAHRPSTGSAGQNIVQPMIAELEKRNIPVMLSTRGTQLLTENGAVTGAMAVNVENGTQYVIHAKSVVIATGNFASNNDMVAQYDPRLKGFGTNSSPGSQGDGIVMGIAVGADLENMEVMRVRPNLPGGVSNAIAVSQDGVRFMNETNTSDTIFVPGEDAHVTVNENRAEKYYWYVMDDAAMTAGKEKMSMYLVEGDYFSAATVEELAKAINVPAAALSATVEEWNGYVSKGSDASFGRTGSMTAPIQNGPFWAVRVTPNVHTTAGGLRINENAQVLNKSEIPITGLYAAGEVTGGVHDGVSAVCCAITYGRIAGTSAGTAAK